jgi:hypothetical protein
MLILFVQTLSASAAAYRGKMKKTRAPANNMKASGERRRKKKRSERRNNAPRSCLSVVVGAEGFSFYYLSTIQRLRAITFSVGGCI